MSTTLSVRECIPLVAFTNENTRVKSVRSDKRIMPKIIVLDPEVTLPTPMPLWLSTGVKALDHAIEALWSVNPQPLTDMLEMEAIRTLHKNLPLTMKEQNNIAAP